MANVSESFSRWRRYVDPYARDAPEISTNLLGKAASVALGIYLLWRVVRWFLLPKPIPGIPYIETSAQNIMGDIPAMTEHIKATDGTFVTYLRSVMERLNSPVVQIFMFPLGKPICSATLPRRKTCSFGVSTSLSARLHWETCFWASCRTTTSTCRLAYNGKPSVA